MRAILRQAAAAAALVASATITHAHISEIQKLTASDGGPNDRFGAATDIDDLTAVVGAPGDGSGTAYVFEGIPVAEQAKLVHPGAKEADAFGTSVSVSGDTIVVGAPERDDNGAGSGAAYVFTRTGTVWAAQFKLLPSAFAADDGFGSSVGIDGETIVVGAPGHDGFAAEAGAAFVFVRTGTVWVEQAVLSSADIDAGDEFGRSVTIAGDTVVCGAPGDSDVQASGGAVYAFDRSGTSWSEDVKLTDAAVGAGDRFGADVDLKGDRLAVGSPFNDSHLPDGGAVFLYDRVGGGWTLTIKLVTVFVTVPFAQAGSSVAVDGDAILGGAPSDLASTGQVYFWAGALGFKEDIMIGSGAVPGDEVGGAVAVAGCLSITGAQYDDELGADAGAAYVHALKHPQELYCTAGTSAAGCTPNIGAVGFASATSPNGFFLFAQNVEGGKDGMFFLGTNGRQANTWGSGTSYQCVIPPVTRGGLLGGSGTPGHCDGNFQQDWNALWCPSCPKPAKNPGPFATVQAQFWYRDPLNTSNQTTSLSNAIEFEVCP